MGSSQSTTQLLEEDDHHQSNSSDSPHSHSSSQDDQEEDDETLSQQQKDSSSSQHQQLVKKILQQEPEMLPYHQSASPLSPQLSTYGTPRVGPNIKVWDPYNVLAPPPPLPPPPHFRRTYSDASSSNGGGVEEMVVTEVYLISHGECHMSLRPDLIGGRCPESKLTGNGKRQARALAVFLKSQGVRFSAVYCSGLDRARATALSVCQELNMSEDHIQSSDALVEMSQGHWEGCHRSDILTPETVSIMDRSQPDFCAPSGESLRQVEFRMIQFLNTTVITFPDKYRTDFSPPDPTDNGTFQNHVSHSLSNHDRDGPSLSPPNWDLLHKHRQGPLRKKSGKSRLQVVTTTGENEADDEMSPREPPMTKGLVRDINVRTGMAPTPSVASSCVGVFTHAIPIKCLLTGLLGCSPVMLHKICVDDSSITVLQHSWKLGWQIKRLNDTSHLRLL